ncbi:MAG: mobilization protein [Herminiimonas sp.]|nr:mobilization protein [Herminiimonas sp.]
MNKTLSSIEERIDAQQKKLAQLKAQKTRLETVQKVREAKVARTEDTRRKILLGAFFLEQMRRDASMDADIRNGLDKWLTRPEDRVLFSLSMQMEKLP